MNITLSCRRRVRDLRSSLCTSRCTPKQPHVSSQGGTPGARRSTGGPGRQPCAAALEAPREEGQQAPQVVEGVPGRASVFTVTAERQRLLSTSPPPVCSLLRRPRKPRTLQPGSLQTAEPQARPCCSRQSGGKTAWSGLSLTHAPVKRNPCCAGMSAGPCSLQKRNTQDAEAKGRGAAQGWKAWSVPTTQNINTVNAD